MKNIILFMLVSLMSGGCADNKDMNEMQNTVTKADYTQELDKFPMPKGGMQAIQNNVVYPPEAKEKNIQGKVLVKLFIDEKGSVTGTEIVQSAGALLDKAAQDAVGKVKFTPGYKDGKAVKAGVIIPILFKLNGDSSKEKAMIKKDGEYYINADQMPEIIGGIKTITDKVVYPESEKKAGRQGKVLVALYINEKGDIEKKEIEKSVNAALDKAALDALTGIGFTPGRVNGKSVKTKIMLPIVFKLH